MSGRRLETIMSYGEVGDEHELQYDTATGQLFVDGEAVVTEKRFSTFERGLAVAGLVIGGIGVAATVVQAVAAILALPR